MKFQRNDIELNEDTLREIFASREVSVPRDYLVFMQQYNGTHPFRAGISGHPEVGIRWFYGVNIPDKNLDLREATTALDASLPLKTIPIAETEGGNALVFREHDVNGVQVWAWDHERQGKEALSLVAETFDELLSRIVETDGEDLGEYTVKKAWIDPALLAKLNKPQS